MLPGKVRAVVCWHVFIRRRTARDNRRQLWHSVADVSMLSKPRMEGYLFIAVPSGRRHRRSLFDGLWEWDSPLCYHSARTSRLLARPVAFEVLPSLVIRPGGRRVFRP